jgi:tetratricopeptide (TPR) repeat protein
VAHLVDAAPSLVTGNVGGFAQTAVGAINAFQLHKLGKQVHAISGQTTALSGAMQHLTQMTQGLTLLAQGALVVSGLNLAVSVASFVVLSNKLGKIDERLKQMSKDIKDIKTFLEIEERSKLQDALNALTGAAGAAEDTRMAMLVSARQILGQIHIKYRELMDADNDYDKASAVEDYFAMTALALARCTAELDLFDFARNELKSSVQIWRSSARRIASRFLDGSERQHLLTAKYSKIIPTDELVDCFDFAYGEDGDINDSKSPSANKGLE